jgi:hypothetical protein
MNIFIKYLYWQLILSPKKVLMITKNYLLFGCEFFSIKETFKSLFAPWKMTTWSYGRGLDVGRYFETFVSNIFTRAIGFVMRTFLIFTFILFELSVLIAGLLGLIFILIYPLLALIGIIYSFKYFNV